MIGLINVGRPSKVLIPSTRFPKIVSFGKYRVVLSLPYTWEVGANIINLVEATAIMPVNTAAVLDLGQKRPELTAPAVWRSLHRVQAPVKCQFGKL